MKSQPISTLIFLPKLILTTLQQSITVNQKSIAVFGSYSYNSGKLL